MLDYKLLEAFYNVINEGGFEKASQSLCITQSAVSQRVKLLEEQSGQVLLVRSNPPKATVAGKKYLNHYLNVRNLEDHLFPEGKDDYLNIIKIGLNADSLATWFMPIAERYLPENRLLDLNVDDQDRTIQFLKSGEVIAAISTYDKPVQGCKIESLGCMEYRALATREFKEKWFPENFTIDKIKRAPALLYNKNDNLHDVFLKGLFDAETEYPRHYIPSSEQFLNFILSGRGYGLVPLLQGEDYIKSGSLIEIIQDRPIFVNLYLHRWNHLPEKTEIFLEDINKNITSYLF